MLFAAYRSDIKNISEKMLGEAEEKMQECMCRWQLTKFKVRKYIQMK